MRCSRQRRLSDCCGRCDGYRPGIVSSKRRGCGEWLLFIDQLSSSASLTSARAHGRGTSSFLLQDDADIMRLLGLSTETHDSGIALLEDGRPTDILEEERLNREKHTCEFPELSLAALFDERRIGEIDAVTTCWDPSLLRRSLISAVCRSLPGSLALLMPASHPTQYSGIVNYWLRRGRDAVPVKTYRPLSSAPSRCACRHLFRVTFPGCHGHCYGWVR